MAENAQVKSPESEEFFKIRIGSINPDSEVPFDIYVQIGNRRVHYLRQGDALPKQKLEQFEQKAPNNFFIKSEDRQTYKDYVHRQVSNLDLPVKQRALILRESSFALVEELFESPDVERALTESREVIADFVDLMDVEPEAMGHLISLSCHDFYTYNHSLDVGIYSLGLAKVLGYDEAGLLEMGEGALFHDIGKRQVPVEIITKDGPLDDIEWSKMRQHPLYGLQILNEQQVSDAVKACCFEHHESMLGNGYPQQLEGDEIHPMARIVALTDTYDALTTKRSYNTPMTPKDALMFMTSKLAGRYDADMLKAMNEVLFHMERAEKK